MISDIEQALYTFWSGFGLEAYRQGEVPSTATLPYITYQVEDGEPFSTNSLSAFVWCKYNKVGVAKRRNILDLVAKEITYKGKRLKLQNGGFIDLYPINNWLSYGVDNEDANVCYGRIAYELTYYHD